MRTVAFAGVLTLLLGLEPLAGQSSQGPPTLEGFEPAQLSGHWHEVATTGSWAHRRCRADTEFDWRFDGPRTARMISTCSTSTGTEQKSGRLKAPPRGQPERLTGSFAPRFFAWLPAAREDYWVLAVGPDQSWVLLGDRARRRLSVLSRVAVLDEAAMASAIHAGRVLGFPTERLAPVAQRIGGRVGTR